jgi:hypothetical protein
MVPNHDRGGVATKVAGTSDVAKKTSLQPSGSDQHELLVLAELDPLARGLQPAGGEFGVGLLDILDAEVGHRADLGVVDLWRHLASRDFPRCIGLMDIEPPPVQVGRRPCGFLRLEPRPKLSQY